MKGLVDFGRVEEMVRRTQGRIDLLELDRVSPLAAPLFLEVGRVPIKGLAEERLLAEEAQRLFDDAAMPDKITTPRRWSVPY